MGKQAPGKHIPWERQQLLSKSTVSMRRVSYPKPSEWSLKRLRRSDRNILLFWRWFQNPELDAKSRNPSSSPDHRRMILASLRVPWFEKPFCQIKCCQSWQSICTKWSWVCGWLPPVRMSLKFQNFIHTFGRHQGTKQSTCLQVTYVQIHEDSVKDLLADPTTPRVPSITLREHPTKGVYMDNARYPHLLMDCSKLNFLSYWEILVGWIL